MRVVLHLRQMSIVRGKEVVLWPMCKVKKKLLEFAEQLQSEENF